MACLRLNLKAQSPNYLLHEALHIRRGPDRLRSRRSLRSFMVTSQTTTTLPSSSRLFEAIYL